ncbi:MAG: hypothetical protein AAF456_25115 [Planctomycetota bacterium]
MTRSNYDPGQSKGRHFCLSGLFCFLFAMTIFVTAGCGKKDSEEPAGTENNVVTPLNIQQPGDDESGSDDGTGDDDGDSSDAG